MQALDSFISPIPRFEGDIPIPAFPVSARSPSGELASDSSAGASVGALKTRAWKRKTTINLTPQKKAKKTTGNSTNGIKINEPAPKASPVLTPPLGSQKKILIHRSNRYA
jgi:hypothetical protein